MKNKAHSLFSINQIIEILVMTLAAISVPLILYIVEFPSSGIHGYIAVILIPAIYLEIYLFYSGLKQAREND